MREQRALSLHDVAAATGLSKSFLSLIERGDSDLSLNRFRALCEFYGLTPAEMLGASNEDPGAETAHAGLEPLRYVSPAEGVEITMLRVPNKFGAMQPALSVYEPGALTEVFQHPGEEFLFVVEGLVRLHLGDEQILLAAFDNHYFSGETPHRFENPDGDRRAVKLTVRSKGDWR
jgi:transcriptional regulator with XRE-family HTH domain